MFNCIYAQNLAFMAEIAQIINKPSEGSFFTQKASAVKNDILTKMWNEEKKMFFAQTEEGAIDFISISNLFP